MFYFEGTFWVRWNAGLTFQWIWLGAANRDKDSHWSFGFLCDSEKNKNKNPKRNPAKSRAGGFSQSSLSHFGSSNHLLELPLGYCLGRGVSLGWWFIFFCTSCCSQHAEQGVLSKPWRSGEVTARLKWEGGRKSEGGSFHLILFSFSSRSFCSLNYDSACLMFVVYRNKHEKVALLLDDGNVVTAQKPRESRQVRGTPTTPCLSSWDVLLKPVARASLLRGVCFCVSVSWGKAADEWGWGRLCWAIDWAGALFCLLLESCAAPMLCVRLPELFKQLTVPGWLCAGSWEKDWVLLSTFHFPVRPTLSAMF